MMIITLLALCVFCAMAGASHIYIVMASELCAMEKVVFSLMAVMELITALVAARVLRYEI